MSNAFSQQAPSGGRSKLSFFGVASAVVGGLLLWYGWERRTSTVGRFSSTIGLSLLAKALSNPAVGGFLGPMQGYLQGPIESAQKLLA